MRGLSSNACRFWSPSWYAQSTGQLYLAAHSSTISTKLNFNSKKTSLQLKKKKKSYFRSYQVSNLRDVTFRLRWFVINKCNVFFITRMDKWVLLLIYIVHHEAYLTLDHIWMLTDNWSFSSQKDTYLWSSEPNPTPALLLYRKNVTLSSFLCIFYFESNVLFFFWKFYNYRLTCMAPSKNIIFWYWFGITQFMFNT